MNVCLLLFLSLSSLDVAYAATHPLTGSSIINQPGNAFAFSQMGFKLDTMPLNWQFNKSLAANLNAIELGVANKTLLTFRMETVSPKTNLERYVRQYLRDYNQYGFEVTSLKSNSTSAIPSVIVDLDQKNKTTKSRQVFFLKKDRMIIATCADIVANFTATVAVCNQVLGSFKWR